MDIPKLIISIAIPLIVGGDIWIFFQKCKGGI